MKKNWRLRSYDLWSTGCARSGSKKSDYGIVEVGLGSTGGKGNRKRSIDLEVSHTEHPFYAPKELGENAVRIIERLWSDMEPADYTITVSRTRASCTFVSRA